MNIDLDQYNSRYAEEINLIFKQYLYGRSMVLFKKMHKYLLQYRQQTHATKILRLLLIATDIA